MAYQRIKNNGKKAKKAGRKKLTDQRKRKVGFHGTATIEDIEIIGVERVPEVASKTIKNLAAKIRKSKAAI